MERSSTIEGSIAKAIENVGHKKFGIAIIGMFLLIQVQAPSWQVFGLGVASVGSELILDMVRSWMQIRYKIQMEAESGV